MKKLNNKQKILFQKISKILWEKWDPIGVYNTEDEWCDEYDSYVPHIFRLTIENNDAIRIANSLSSTVKNDIGLGANTAHDLKVAKLIVEAKKEIIGDE